MCSLYANEAANPRGLISPAHSLNQGARQEPDPLFPDFHQIDEAVAHPNDLAPVVDRSVIVGLTTPGRFPDQPGKRGCQAGGRPRFPYRVGWFGLIDPVFRARPLLVRNGTFGRVLS